MKFWPDIVRNVTKSDLKSSHDWYPLRMSELNGGRVLLEEEDGRVLLCLVSKCRLFWLFWFSFKSVERALREESTTMAIPAMVNRTIANLHDVTLVTRKWNDSLIIMMFDSVNCCKSLLRFQFSFFMWKGNQIARHCQCSSNNTAVKRASTVVAVVSTAFGRSQLSWHACPTTYHITFNSLPRGRERHPPRHHSTSTHKLV